MEEALPAAGQQKTGRKKKKRTAAGYAVSFFVKVGVTVLVLWILFSFVLGVYVCHDNNAYPMIKDGDLCVTFRLDTFRQGDAIVYHTDETERFGRVIAQDGDVVDIDGGNVTVNGYFQTEHTVYPTTKEGTVITFPYKVPDDCVFVLNDHRENADDSRRYGAIPLSAARGKVILVLRRRGI